MYEAVPTIPASVVYVTVSGFAEKKIKYWFPEYFFVMEVYWSNKRTTFVKRNYDEVMTLYQRLLGYFRSKYENGDIKTPVNIPMLEGKKLFQRNSVELAEQREFELQNFFKQLLERNSLISSNKIVLDFFKHRPTDPQPNEEHTNDTDNDEDVLFDR